MVCVRKRLLTFENDDENVFPHKIKRSKHDSPTKAIYRSSIFNTPSTPSTLNLQPQLTNCKNAMQNISSNCFPLNNAGAVGHQQIDPFKTPTKQRSSSATVLGQLQNSPNSIVIPETPPKSSQRPDKKVQAQSASLKFKRLLNSPSSTAATGFFLTASTTVTNNSTNKSTTTTSKSHHHKSSNLAFLSNSMSNVNLNCKCFGLDQICKICAKRNECMAPRAGTPGTLSFFLILWFIFNLSFNLILYLFFCCFVLYFRFQSTRSSTKASLSNKCNRYLVRWRHICIFTYKKVSIFSQYRWSDLIGRDNLDFRYWTCTESGSSVRQTDDKFREIHTASWSKRDFNQTERRSDGDWRFGIWFIR